MKKIKNEATDISSVIKGMQGNFGGDNESQMKGLQLLKGLATSDDPKANAFMKALNTATTKISKEVLGGKAESMMKEGASQTDVARDAISKFIKDKKPMPVADLKKLLNMISESTLKEGWDAYCPNCGENNGKASEVMDDSGEVYCDNCGTTYYAESTKKSTKDNILEAETFKCPDCGSKVLKQTGYCVSCKKKVGGKKKEDIITVEEDVKIGDMILEAGDEIKILSDNDAKDTEV